jgi:hypothetical protein
MAKMKGKSGFGPWAAPTAPALDGLSFPARPLDSDTQSGPDPERIAPIERSFLILGNALANHFFKRARLENREG